MRDGEGTGGRMERHKPWTDSRVNGTADGLLVMFVRSKEIVVKF